MENCRGCEYEEAVDIRTLIMVCSECRRAFDCKDYRMAYYKDLYSKKKEGEESDD